MNNELIIIKPSLEDYEIVNNIAVQVHGCHVKWRPDIFINSDIIIEKDEYKDMIENDNILVAKLNDKVIGYVLLSKKEGAKNGYRYRKQINIDAIGVDINYRGHGIGTKIVNYVNNYAKENNYTDIGLSVSPENKAAKALYEKLGFKIKNISYTKQI